MPISKIKTSSITADAASVNLNIDANTLFLDVANNRVGISKSNPSQALDVAGNIKVSTTDDWIYANNYGLISSSAPMKFSSNADWNWVRHSAGTTAMSLLQNGGLTVDHASSGAYLTLSNSDSSIGGGESINFNLNYTTTTNSTNWSMISRYAGDQLQLISNYNAGGGFTRLTLNRNGNLTLGDEAAVAISGMSRYLSIRATGAEEASAIELVGNRNSGTVSSRISFVNNTSEIARITALATSGNASSLGALEFQTSGTQRMKIENDGVIVIGENNSMTPLGEWVTSGTNLLINGDFSAGMRGWSNTTFGFGSAYAGVNFPSDGQRTCSGYGNNGGGLTQAVYLVPGATYTLVGKLRVGPANNINDGSYPRLTVGDTTSGTLAYRNLVDQGFSVNNYDTSPNTYRYIWCKTTFTAPLSNNSQNVLVYVGFRSESNTHSVLATDMGLYKGAVVPEYNPVSKPFNSNETVIDGVLTTGALRYGQFSNNSSSGVSDQRQLLGVWQYAIVEPSNTYLHMKTNMKSNSGYYNMYSWRAWGYRYNSADTIYSFFSGHNWNGGVYSGETLNIGGYAFAVNQYISSDGYLVLVAATSTGSQYVSFSLDLHLSGVYSYTQSVADRTIHHTVTNTAYSNSTSGVY